MSEFRTHLDLWKKKKGRRCISTFFKYNRFSIDAEIHKKWGNYDDYLMKYRLLIDNSIYDKISPTAASIIKELSEFNNTFFSVEENLSEKRMLEDKTPYIRCVFEKSLLEFFKRLFVSTIVYEAKHLELPENEHETMDFLFDTQNKTVTLIDIHLYEPDDPYFEYARNAVYTLSVEAIGIGDYSMSDDKVKDFYKWENISAWKKREKIMEPNGESSLEQKCGIYMLYDSESNEFYIGKARNLRERIIQHAKNVLGNDPIPNFTHYRYSIINMEYFEFLYLIENAAIHDCAMILDMPKASKLNKPLVHVASNAGQSLDKCTIVNTHERQRKKENSTN